MSVPLIGLTTYREQAAWGVWNQRADLLHVDYADSVVRAGGVPVMLPPAVVGPDGSGGGSIDVEDAAEAVVARIDALVISGGADVDPARYGEPAAAHTRAVRPDRDTWELALLAAADRVGLPVLGICRGMQLMAVAAGGALDQHTPDLVGHDEHSPGGDRFGAPALTVAPGTRVQSILGSSVVGHCHHHQSVRTHPGYVAAAHAADGTLEAMETPGPRFRVGVQWHPEMTDEIALLAALVAAVKAD